MAWLATVPRSAASGDLAAAYEAMDNRPMPPVYRPGHGDAAGIIRAHSLDAELLRRTFAVSGALAQSGVALAGPGAAGQRHVPHQPVLLLNVRSRGVSACRQR